MLSAYGTANDCLTECPPSAGPGIPPDSVWVDLVEPTAQEEALVESSLGIDIPTREELAEIEASSRLYQEDGAAFMTANLIRRGEHDEPESSPVTFIIKDNTLITIRYHHPQAFPAYVKRAMKPQATAMNGWGILISLLEAVVDRAADHLERAGQIVDETSKKTFGAKRALSGIHKPAPRRTVNLQELIENIGEEGDFISKMRESLVSIGRMVTFMQAISDQMRETKFVKENKARMKILQRDIISLTDHASFLSGKIAFLLDAVLGLISIEQNGIIKIFSVAAVVFLPPTLVASIYGMNFAFMPELQWPLGYPLALLLMVFSAILPFLYFKRKGWL
ncbi:magnesium/cobalt transporter CorA [Aestuariivirga sp.]|jgi:magnesium transporter|uniref:magnesium/cobalt transporter CorA n=1 Tax=Aestuariivirga sp. TaxID=2650926 RepID=UPI003784DF59